MTDGVREDAVGGPLEVVGLRALAAPVPGGQAKGRRVLLSKKRMIIDLSLSLSLSLYIYIYRERER